jgi:hypothetical protein
MEEHPGTVHEGRRPPGAATTGAPLAGSQRRAILAWADGGPHFGLPRASTWCRALGPDHGMRRHERGRREQHISSRRRCETGSGAGGRSRNLGERAALGNLFELLWFFS